jgi:hypothetical protein
VAHCLKIQFDILFLLAILNSSAFELNNMAAIDFADGESFDEPIGWNHVKTFSLVGVRRDQRLDWSQVTNSLQAVLSLFFCECMILVRHLLSSVPALLADTFTRQLLRSPEEPSRNILQGRSEVST